jgi:hypothetical protein
VWLAACSDIRIIFVFDLGKPKKLRFVEKTSHLPRQFRRRPHRAARSGRIKLDSKD